MASSKPVPTVVDSSVTPVPQKIFDIMYAFGRSYCMITACELGIFDLLQTAGKPLSANEIAKQLSTDPDATSRLLDVLVTLELLVKQIGTTEEAVYCNTPLGDVLTTSNPSHFREYVMTIRDVETPIIANHFTQAIREGANQWKQTFNTEKGELFTNLCDKNQGILIPFCEGMRGRVKAAAPSFLTAFDLSRFKRMCDLGGGSGDVAYAASMAYPNMKITVLELAEVVDVSSHFRPSMDEFPNQQNVTFAVGDFFKPQLPAADLYVLTHVIHDWKEDKIDILLSNIFQNLPSGGGILIGELLLFDDKSGPLNVQLYSLYMLAICDGCERSGLEYRKMLEKHGFKDVQMKYTHTSSLDAVLAIKP